MRNPLRTLASCIENLNLVVYWLSAGAIILSSLILTYEVVMRYLLQIPTIWEIESAVYLGVMATFMGAAYGLKDGAHINIDLVTRTLSERLQRKVQRLSYFISLLFCVYLAYKGWEYWWEAFSKGWRSESLWGPPLAIPYFFLPMGMTLLSLQFLVEIFRSAKKNEGA